MTNEIAETTASKATDSRPLTCWAISDGRAGIQVQCTGLAEALGLTPEIKQVQMRAPWRWLPPAVIPVHPAVYGPAQIRSDMDWPDIAIACGRQAAVFNQLVRRLSGGRTFCIQMQDPRVDPARYDLVITPEHDNLRGPNVLTTRGAINRIQQTRLNEDAAKLAPKIAHLPRPLVAVLVGGNSKAYRLTEAVIRRLGDDLRRLQAESSCGFLVTPSRRTGAENEKILRQYLEGLPAYIWDGSGDNPYFGFLGSADAIVVTGDSVNMVTEAATTGKPVYVVPLEGGSKKFDRFHAILREAGITHPFAGRLEHWTYEPLAEPTRIAKLVMAHLEAEGRLPRKA